MSENVRRNWFQELLEINKFVYFIIIALVAVGVNFYFSNYSNDPTIVYNSYSESLTIERVKDIIDTRKKLEWASWLLIPTVILFRIVYFTICLSISSFFFSENVSYRKVYNIVLKAEIVFSVMLIVKVVMLQFFLNINTLDDLNLIPFSLLNLIGSANVPTYLRYPVQLINPWEIIYSAFIILALYKTMEPSKIKVLKIFSFGYIGGLLLWVLFIVFLTIQFS